VEYSSYSTSPSFHSYIFHQLKRGRCKLFVDIAPSFFSVSSLLDEISDASVYNNNLQKKNINDNNVNNKNNINNFTDPEDEEILSKLSFLKSHFNIVNSRYDKNVLAKSCSLLSPLSSFSSSSQQNSSRTSFSLSVLFPTLFHHFFLVRFFLQSLFLIQSFALVSLRFSDFVGIISSYSYVQVFWKYIFIYIY
jgi:hypothetical protein